MHPSSPTTNGLLAEGLGREFFTPLGHFPVLDSGGQLLDWLVAAIVQTQAEPGRWVVCGHADAIGDPKSVMKLSVQRATAVAALLRRDACAWKPLCPGGTQRELILILASIAYLTGWGSPAKQGTLECIKTLQNAVIELYHAPLVADGRQTVFAWEAVFVAMLHLVRERMVGRSDVAVDGDGWWQIPVLSPCGEGVVGCGSRVVQARRIRMVPRPVELVRAQAAVRMNSP